MVETPDGFHSLDVHPLRGKKHADFKNTLSWWAFGDMRLPFPNVFAGKSGGGRSVCTEASLE